MVLLNQQKCHSLLKEVSFRRYMSSSNAHRNNSKNILQNKICVRKVLPNIMIKPSGRIQAVSWRPELKTLLNEWYWFNFKPETWSVYFTTVLPSCLLEDLSTNFNCLCPCPPCKEQYECLSTILLTLILVNWLWNLWIPPSKLLQGGYPDS